MPESNEQGLVERLLAGAKPEPKIDTTLFVSEERQRELLFRVTLPFAGPDDIADAIREAIEETVRTIQRHTRDRATTAEAQIADLKRALDTARNDAMEEGLSERTRLQEVECERLRKEAHEAPLNPLRTNHDGHRWVEQQSTAWVDRSREWVKARNELDRLRSQGGQT